MLNYIKQGALVIFLALAFGGALAAVQTQLGPMIKANQKIETLLAIPNLMSLGQKLPDDAIIVPDADAMEIRVSVPVEGGEPKLMFTELVRKIDVPNSPKTKLFEIKVLTPAMATMLEKGVLKPEQLPVLGYMIETNGMGYGDKITALVGVEKTCNWITGVYILDQKETPGLGDKIRGKWSNQFAGMGCKDPLHVIKGLKKPAKGEAVTSASQLGAIDAIAGATISSDAVTGIVNNAIAEIRTALAAVKAKGGSNAK